MQRGLTKVYVYLAYIASVVMILGINLPQYIEGSKKSTLVMVSRIDQEGILLLISSLIVIMLRYYKKKKYILAPLIFQIGIIIYYIYLFITSKNFYMIHVGFMFEMLAIVFLIMSMFVSLEINKEYIHDMSTLKIVKVDESNYDDKIIIKDLTWIIISVVLTSIILGFKIQINRQDKALSEIKTSKLEKNIDYSLDVNQ